MLGQKGFQSGLIWLHILTKPLRTAKLYLYGLEGQRSNLHFEPNLSLILLRTAQLLRIFWGCTFSFTTLYLNFRAKILPFFCKDWKIKFWIFAPKMYMQQRKIRHWRQIDLIFWQIVQQHWISKSMQFELLFDSSVSIIERANFMTDDYCISCQNDFV